MCYLTTAFALLALVGGNGPEHPASLSHLLIDFQQDTIQIELRIQELTLGEVPRWSLDNDASGHISTSELEANWDRVAALVEESLWLEFDGETVHPAFAIARYIENSSPNADGSIDFTHVVLQAQIPRPASLKHARVHSDLFVDDGNPRHTLHITIKGLEGADRLYLLRGDARDYVIHLPSRSEILGQYIHLGWSHVLEGYDHLAFLIALLFGVATLGRLLGAITAFTLAHSITLALSALQIVRLPSSLVEPGIALSVLAVLILHLRRPATESHPWMPAFGFGLLHGFGFAGALGDIGIPPQDQAVSLLGFNLGVETGQLSFVIPVVLAATLLWKTIPSTYWPRMREWLALPTLAFAMFLVGNAILRYYFGNFAEFQGRVSLLLVGFAAAGLFSLLPGGLSGAIRRQRVLTAQAALLLCCFSFGQILQG